ncbi:hypothetical protein [Streptomyces sp. NPDC091405]
MTRGGKDRHYLTDALGSVVALTDEAGAKVNAWTDRGEPMTASWRAPDVP